MKVLITGATSGFGLAAARTGARSSSTFCASRPPHFAGLGERGGLAPRTPQCAPSMGLRALPRALSLGAEPLV